MRRRKALNNPVHAFGSDPYDHSRRTVAISAPIENFAGLVQPCERCPVLRRNVDLQYDPIGSDTVLHRIEKGRNSLSRQRGYNSRPRLARRPLRELTQRILRIRGKRIDLVPDFQETRTVVRVDA